MKTTKTSSMSRNNMAKTKLSMGDNGLVSLTRVFELEKSQSDEISKLIEKRIKVGKELTVKLKDLGLVSASDEVTVVD